MKLLSERGNYGSLFAMNVTTLQASVRKQAENWTLYTLEQLEIKFCKLTFSLFNVGWTIVTSFWMNEFL
jgi:hypothetical protein